MECYYALPTFGRKLEDLEIVSEIFSKHLSEHRNDDIVAAFNQFMKTGMRFPVVADILELLTPKIAYQMDYGPKGFGALYDESHPYVRLQIKMGQDISRYKREVSPIHGSELKGEASVAPSVEFSDDDYEIWEEEARLEVGGFRRIR